MAEPEVHLVRHGHHDWLLPGQNRLAGTVPGVGLNERGRTEAAWVAAMLSDEPLQWVVASPLQRTLETAEIIARQHRLEVTTDDRFLEWRLGPWEGMWIDEIRSRHPTEWRIWREDPVSLRLPGAETLAEVADRMEAAFHDWAGRGGSGVIVSHQDPLTALLCRLIDIPLAHTRTLHIRTGSLSTCRLLPHGHVVASINTGTSLVPDQLDD